MVPKYLMILMTGLFLTACELAPVKEKTDLVDLLETQKRADEAYWNEDWAVAEEDYLYLSKQVPAEAEPWFRLGNIYARTERLDAAVDAYREALIRDNSNSKIWHNLGVVQLRQASNTFLEMIEYTDPADPLNKRARDMLDTIARAMASRFGVTVSE